MFRFLHSSDLHLGKPFGRHAEDVRGRLRQARHSALDRLAQAARDGGAGTILLAGDTFDQETPAPTVTRQALNAMAQAADLTWVVMPGNHDSLAATELWQTIARDKPDNVILALSSAPAMLEGAVVLPAPCTARNPGRDLTIEMDQPTPDGVIRVGLGHGGIHDFGSDAPDGPTGIIAPDRAAQAGLDYLGLGDWHGQIRITPDTWYSGTPEPDSFKHNQTGLALLVAIEAQGATPSVTPVPVGEITWQRLDLDLTPGEDIAALLGATLPDLAARRDTLVDLVAQGRLGLRERHSLQTLLDRAAPDFMSFKSDLAAVQLAQEASDLDGIDPSGGALRQAAETLSARTQDPDLSAEDRRTALSALSHLFSFVAVEEEA